MFLNWRMEELPMKKQKHFHNIQTKLLAAGSIMGLLVLPLSACSLLPKEEAALAPPLVQPAKVQYNVAEVKQGNIVKRVKGVGTLTPINNNNLFYSEAGGRLKKIHVAEGDVVKKGQVLAEIDNGNLNFDIKQTEIDQKKAEIHLKQLQSQQADQYAIDIAKLDLESVQSKLQNLKEQQAKSVLTSPIKGIVTFVGEQKAGDIIEAFKSIIQVADTKQLQLLYTSTSGDEIADIKIGMKAGLTLNGQEFTGKVVHTPQDIPADIVAANPDLYKNSIFISIDSLPKAAHVGDSVDFEVITKQKDNTLIIPKNGLRTLIGRNYVQVLDQNTKRELDIEVGIISSTEVEVLKGLNAGDKVILK